MSAVVCKENYFKILKYKRVIGIQHSHMLNNSLGDLLRDLYRLLRVFLQT